MAGIAVLLVEQPPDVLDRDRLAERLTARPTPLEPPGIGHERVEEFGSPLAIVAITILMTVFKAAGLVFPGGGRSMDSHQCVWRVGAAPSMKQISSERTLRSD